MELDSCETKGSESGWFTMAWCSYKMLWFKLCYTV